MRSRASVFVAAALSSLLLLAGACKTDQKKQSPKKDATSGDGTGVPPSTASGTCPSTATTLALTDPAASYTGGIQALLSGKCTSCHTSGVQAPDLSSYSTAKAQASASLTDINSGSMPPGAPLTSTEKALFQAWVTAGSPETAATTTGTDTSTTGTSDNSSTGTSTTCPSTSTTTTAGTNGTTGTGTTGTGTTGTGTNSASDTSTSGQDPVTTADTTDPWDELLNPPAMQTCVAQGKLYERATQVCYKASIATSYQCTHAGIVAGFLKIKASVDSQVTSFETAGYQIDQCGEYNGEPVVTFYKKVDGANDLTLQLKKLCKANSAACIP